MRRGEVSLDEIWDSEQLDFKQADEVLVKRSQEIFRSRQTKLVANAIAAAGLPDQQLQIVCSKAIGKTEREIAAELGISRNTVKTHWKRAAEKLRPHLENNPEAIMLEMLIEVFGWRTCRLAGYTLDN